MNKEGQSKSTIPEPLSFSPREMEQIKRSAAVSKRERSLEIRYSASGLPHLRLS